jgi:hypothetical protein
MWSRRGCADNHRPIDVHSTALPTLAHPVLRDLIHVVWRSPSYQDFPTLYYYY